MLAQIFWQDSRRNPPSKLPFRSSQVKPPQTIDPPKSTMAAPASSDAARARVMGHMNGSHSRELSHYLRHYAGLSQRAAADAKLTDLSLSSMRIRSRGGEHAVAFEPPLDAWSEMRPRVVEMDRIARESLGLSDVYITEYAPPKGFDIAVAGAVAFYFISYLALPWIQPGTAVWDLLATWFPGGPKWYTWLVRIIVLPVLAIHLGEGFWFNRTRMAPHGVLLGSALWWKWQVGQFFDGVCSFHRVDAVIAAKKAEKAAKSH